MSLNYRHRVLEQTNSSDFNSDLVFFLERKSVRRHDARAGQQHRAVRKNLAAKKKTGQFLEAALDLADRGFAAENSLSAAPDFNFDFPLTRGAFRRAEM